MRPTRSLRAPEHHATIRFGGGHSGALAVTRGPFAQKRLDPLARADLRRVRLQGRALDLERAADVDPRVRGTRAADEHLLHLVRREACREELGKYAGRLRRPE